MAQPKQTLVTMTYADLMQRYQGYEVTLPLVADSPAGLTCFLPHDCTPQQLAGARSVLCALSPHRNQCVLVLHVPKERLAPKWQTKEEAP